LVIYLFAVGIQEAPAFLRPRGAQGLELVPQPKIAYDLAVGLHVRTPQVVEKTAASANHLQETAAAMMVLHVSPEMVREEVDSLGEKDHLHPC
jgi:hypothetical protein